MSPIRRGDTNITHDYVLAIFPSRKAMLIEKVRARRQPLPAPACCTRDPLYTRARVAAPAPTLAGRPTTTPGRTEQAALGQVDTTASIMLNSKNATITPGTIHLCFPATAGLALIACNVLCAVRTTRKNAAARTRTKEGTTTKSESQGKNGRENVQSVYPSQSS